MSFKSASAYRRFMSSTFSCGAYALLVSCLPVIGQAATQPVDESDDGLEAVIVTAQRIRAGGIKEDNGTGSRLGLTALETPASIETLQGDVIRARGDVSMVEAAARTAGVTQASAHNGGALSARGFSGSNSVMRLYDGTRMYVTGGTVTFPFDTWTIDSLEVLRGAASVLYGEGAIGAAVNVVPKKPTAGPIRSEARLTYGSNNTQRGAIDNGGSITDQLAYRVNASGNRSEGDVDKGDSSSVAFAGGLSFTLSPDLKFTLTHDYGKQKPSIYYGIPLIDGRLDERLKHTNYNVSDAATIFIDNWTRLKTEWRISDAISINNQTYYLRTARRWNNDVRNYTYNAATATVTRGGSQNLYYEMGQTGNRFDVLFNTNAFGLENATTVGFDFNRMNYLRSRAFSGATSTVSAFNYHPSSFPATVASNTERYGVHTNTVSLFAEDRLKLTQRWSLVGGYRWDHIHVDRYSLTDPRGTFITTFIQPSWRVGTVFESTPTLSFYGQYATAVDPLTDVMNTTALQSDFKMATGKQIEVGMKRQFAGGRGEWTLAIYRIVKNNLLVRHDITGNASAPESWDQVGEQSSRGVEVSLGFALTDTLRLDVNGAALKAQYEDFQEVANGVLVSRNGKTPTDIPLHTGNLWLTWRLHPQWNVLGGLRYVARRYTNTANTAELPAYMVLDVGVQWQLHRNLSFALQGYNLLDRFYAQAQWNGQLVLGRERAAELSVDFKF